MATIEPESTYTNESIRTNLLPDYRTEEQELVSKRLLHKTWAGLGVFLGLLCIVAFVVFVMHWVEVFYLSLAFLGVFFIVSFIAIYHYMAQKNYGYVVREKDILFQKGVWVIKTTIVPFNRVQHVSTTQSLFDKYFKLKNVKIFTAGGQGSDIKIPGLTPEKALQIKEWIAHKIVAEELYE